MSDTHRRPDRAPTGGRLAPEGMEIVEFSGNYRTQHKWLQWMGLQEPPVEADSWIPIARALRVTDPATGTSVIGSRLVDLLGEKKIQAHQRSYMWADARLLPGAGLWTGKPETRIAVVVHERDREPATAVAEDLKRTLQREAWANAISVEELSREALEAGPAPDG